MEHGEAAVAERKSGGFHATFGERLVSRGERRKSTSGQYGQGHQSELGKEQFHRNHLRSAWNVSGSDPGAQTEHPGWPWPVRALLGGRNSPALFD
jgi:hypothetical protein